MGGQTALPPDEIASAEDTAQSLGKADTTVNQVILRVSSLYSLNSTGANPANSENELYLLLILLRN